jgi:hypothetical protein
MGKEMENLVMKTLAEFRTIAEYDRQHNGVIESNQFGLWSDGDEAPRCQTCDSRYCGTRCHSTKGTVYVVLFGYRTPEHAKRMEALGAEVRWDQEGFFPPAS